MTDKARRQLMISIMLRIASDIAMALQKSGGDLRDGDGKPVTVAETAALSGLAMGLQLYARRPDLGGMLDAALPAERDLVSQTTASIDQILKKEGAPWK